jgi:hypothetical protein
VTRYRERSLKRPRWRGIVLGTLAGLLVGGVIGGLCGPLGRSEVRAVPLVEDGGRITRVVMQYRPDAGPLVASIYARFLSAISDDAEVVWVVGNSSDVDDLKSRLGVSWPAGRCRAVVVGKEITTWAKDRFTAMQVPGSTGFAVLCAPARTRTASPLRTNDQEVPYRLARDPSRLFRARGTDADFDGGDFLAVARHLFAGQAVIEKNAPDAGLRFRSTAELTKYLDRKMGRKITWLDGAPDHHLGMFLSVMGRTAAIGDVRLAEQVAKSHPEVRAALQPAGGEADPEFCAELAARLDRVARRMESLGYTVVRVPLLPSATPRAWMSYNNGIVETRDGNTVFYMPTFGAPALDTAAAESFQTKIGCKVVPIDCARVWQFGGSLHCLVNVVERKKD